MSSAVDEAGTPPLRERVYAVLRDDVVNGDIGAGTRLTEPKLAARFGISRTPVREALGRLVADGLLQREEDYGYSVVVPDLAGVRDLWEVRIAVELRGIDRCRENPGTVHDAGALRAELARWHRMLEEPPEAGPGFVLEDERFHSTLLAAAGNPELVAVLTDVHRRTRRVRMNDYVLPGRVEAAVSEHFAVAEAVLTGRLDTARHLLHQHMGASLEIVTERAGRALLATGTRDRRRGPATLDVRTS
jgi:DNA-binding GntR family transcriptional regulator